MSAKTTGTCEKGPESVTPGGTPEQSDIRFDPRRLMAAMTFHACESGMVEEVSPSSIRLTMRRLVRQRVSAVMPRTRWATLTDPQRMQWLLKVTRTDFEAASEGYGVFKERDTAAAKH
jgi:hypothetical protein